MSTPTQPTARHLAAAGIFENEAAAQQAVDALRQVPVDESQISLFSPSTAGDLNRVLREMGIPDGEVRFYASEVQAGRTLVIVVGADDAQPSAREVLQRFGGHDIQSQGGDLAAPDGAGVPGGTGPRPIDLTGNWEDVASRYQMLWAQHYGTGDENWEQVEQIYRWAWQAANAARNRGRPWTEVESALQTDWKASGNTRPWPDAAGPIRDVWEDVAEEAAQGAEGGQDRRIARQGTDQTVPAREVTPPG